MAADTSAFENGSEARVSFILAHRKNSFFRITKIGTLVNGVRRKRESPRFTP
jgi:hypothetical protein